ncbi:hypothetical protein J7U46_09510 [Pelomonas sp. V22]|uniref:hypothetical protein n=1 Tax=Pelomonas sp. V22 TaxID=2822139 RepID=UPI0024A7D097|nr:hypothetical protein [Pelomonas sp. V22]MDI4633282.1 hypothetical protein [Pelomonas sp. V22]
MANDDASPALLKVLWAWLFVGLSQMSPLQWIQFVAAIAATIYSLVQTWLAIMDRIIRDKPAKVRRK